MNPINELPKSFEYIKRYLPKDFIKVVNREDAIFFTIGDADLLISKISGKMLSCGNGGRNWADWKIKRK